MPFHWFPTYQYQPSTSQIATASSPDWLALAQSHYHCSLFPFHIHSIYSLSFYSFPYFWFLTFVVFFDFSYFIIPTSLLVDYILYDIYTHSLAYIYITVFCSVVLQLCHDPIHSGHSDSIPMISDCFWRFTSLMDHPLAPGPAPLDCIMPIWLVLHLLCIYSLLYTIASPQLEDRIDLLSHNPKWQSRRMKESIRSSGRVF